VKAVCNRKGRDRTSFPFAGRSLLMQVLEFTFNNLGAVMFSINDRIPFYSVSE